MIENYNKFKELNEYKYNLFTDDELLEMANVADDITGIKNVVLWLGPPPPSHGHRIKVSNVPNSFQVNDCFTITIPDFKIIGKVNKSLITKDKLNKIIKFIEINIEVIVSYSKYEMSTLDFLNSLIKV